MTASLALMLALLVTVALSQECSWLLKPSKCNFPFFDSDGSGPYYHCTTNREDGGWCWCTTSTARSADGQYFEHISGQGLHEYCEEVQDGHCLPYQKEQGCNFPFYDSDGSGPYDHCTANRVSDGACWCTTSNERAADGNFQHVSGVGGYIWCNTETLRPTLSPTPKPTTRAPTPRPTTKEPTPRPTENPSRSPSMTPTELSTGTDAAIPAPTTPAAGVEGDDTSGGWNGLVNEYGIVPLLIGIAIVVLFAAIVCLTICVCCNICGQKQKFHTNQQHMHMQMQSASTHHQQTQSPYIHTQQLQSPYMHTQQMPPPQMHTQQIRPPYMHTPR